MSRLGDDRVAALSEQLINAHQTLRERLASLRREVADGTARPSFPEDLPGHCLSFCGAVHTHHTGEDDQVFPALRAAAPKLAPVIDKLTEDHALVAGILQRIREFLASRSVTSPAALLRELDGLTAILESHFSFEERRVARALDTLDPGTIDLRLPPLPPRARPRIQRRPAPGAAQERPTPSTDGTRTRGAETLATG